jgi:hypothetical protein
MNVKLKKVSVWSRSEPAASDGCELVPLGKAGRLRALLRPAARPLLALLPPAPLVSGAQRSRSNCASLHVRAHEGVGVLLRLLRRLFVMLEVMSEVLHRLLEWHIEGVGRARKNNDVQIRLALGCLA